MTMGQKQGREKFKIDDASNILESIETNNYRNEFDLNWNKNDNSEIYKSRKSYSK